MAHGRTQSLQVEVSDGGDDIAAVETQDARAGDDLERVSLVVPKGDKPSLQKEKPEWIALPDQPKETHLWHTLKPITSLPEAFEDLTSRAMKNGLRQVLSSLAGRAIRVATMCSGTESPIVALELIRDCKVYQNDMIKLLTRSRSERHWARIQF